MSQPEITWQYTPYSSFTTRTANYAMTAAAALAPKREVFFRPEPNVPTPMTYDDDGSVYGHLALSNSCHRGFLNGGLGECVKPPTSKTDYGQFHLGQIQTAEGDMLGVGKITFETTHAPIDQGLAAATGHYDNTGTVGAYVRARDGRLGIWLSGVLKSDLPPAGLVALRANPLSGDWRAFNRNLELVAALAVPVPGFAIPLALSASGEVSSLILPPTTEWEVDMPTYTPSEAREKHMLLERSLTAAVLTTKARNALSDSDFALSGRRYPIQDIAHARNALARSSGKPEEGQVRAAVCKRYPDLGECGD